VTNTKTVSAVSTDTGRPTRRTVLKATLGAIGGAVGLGLVSAAGLADRSAAASTEAIAAVTAPNDSLVVADLEL